MSRGAYPNVIKVKRLRDKHWPQAWVGENWTPARPISHYTLRERIIIAWRVFRGRYDALDWS